MNKDYVSALEKIKLSDEFKDSAVEKLKKLQQEENDISAGADRYNVSEFKTAETVNGKPKMNRTLKISLMSAAGAAAALACVFGAVRLSEYYATTPDVQSATTTESPSITTSNDLIDVDGTVTLWLDKTIYTSADEYGTLTIKNGLNSKTSPMFTMVAGVERWSDDTGTWEETEFSRLDLMVSAAFKVNPGEETENTVPISSIYATYGAGNYRIVKHDVGGSNAEYTISFAIVEGAVLLSSDKSVYTAADAVGTLTAACGKADKISLAAGVTIERRSDMTLEWVGMETYEDSAASIELLTGELYRFEIPIGELYSKYGVGDYRAVKRDFASDMDYTLEFGIAEELPTLPEYVCDGHSNTSTNFAMAILIGGSPVENPTLPYGTAQLELMSVMYNSEGMKRTNVVDDNFTFLTKNSDGDWVDSKYKYISNAAPSEVGFPLYASLNANVPDVHFNYSEAPLPVGEYMLEANIEGHILDVRFNISDDITQVESNSVLGLSAKMNAGEICVYNNGEAPDLTFTITNNSTAVFLTEDRRVQLIFGDDMMNTEYYFDIPMPESIQPNESVSFTLTAEMLTYPYWLSADSTDVEYYLNLAAGYGSFAAGNYAATVILIDNSVDYVRQLGTSHIGILDENGKLYREVDYDIYNAMGGRLEVQTEKSEYTLAEIGNFVKVYYQNMTGAVIYGLDLSLIEKQNADGSWTEVENQNPVDGPMNDLIIRDGKTVSCSACGTITQTGHYRVRLYGFDEAAEFDVIDGKSVCDIPTYTADGYSNTSKHFAAAFTDDSGNYTECPSITYGGDVPKLNYAVAVKHSDGLDDAVFTGTPYLYYVKNSDGQWADCGSRRDIYSKALTLSKSGKALTLTAALSYYENSDSSAQIPLPVGEYILVKEIRNGEATENLFLRFDIVESSVYDEMPLTTVDGLSNKSEHFMAAAYDGSLNYSECPQIP